MNSETRRRKMMTTPTECMICTQGYRIIHLTKKALLLVPSDEINAAKLDALSTIYITIPSKAPWLHVHISKEMTSGTIVHLQKI